VSGSPAARYAGRRLEVRLGPTHLTVYDGLVINADYARSLRKSGEDLLLDNYLEVLSCKPSAFAGRHCGPHPAPRGPPACRIIPVAAD
jgi:hypothetical protein